MTHALRRRRLLLAALALLALLLASIAAIVRHDGKARTQRRGAERQPARIVIERGGFADVVLQRIEPTADASEWRIASPCPLPIERQRLLPLLEAVNSVSARYSRDEVDLAGAGLLAPDGYLNLDGERLAIGGTDVSEQRRYVLTGDTVELLPEWILPLVNGGMTAFADPRVLQGEAIRVTGPGDDTSAVADWNALDANQIVSWPLADPEPVIGTTEHVVTYDDGRSATLSLTRTARYLAVVTDGAACAHLLAPDALPDH